MRLEGPGEAGDAVDEMVGELAGLVDADPRLRDLAVGLALDASAGKGGLVDVDLTVDTPTPEAAAALGVGVVRTAIHAMGAATPGWENTSPVEATVTFALDEQSLHPVD